MRALLAALCAVLMLSACDRGDAQERLSGTLRVPVRVLGPDGIELPREAANELRYALALVPAALFGMADRANRRLRGYSKGMRQRIKLAQALLHDLKCAAWPQSSYVRHWTIEARAFRQDAADVYTPSMRQRVDLDGLYRKALSRMPPDVDGYPPLPMPDACPVTLDELLSPP